MSEKTSHTTPKTDREVEQMHALSILDEIEEAIMEMSADFREFRLHIAHLGLLDFESETVDVAE